MILIYLQCLGSERKNPLRTLGRPYDQGVNFCQPEHRQGNGSLADCMQSLSDRYVASLSTMSSLSAAVLKAEIIGISNLSGLIPILKVDKDQFTYLVYMSSIPQSSLEHESSP